MGQSEVNLIIDSEKAHSSQTYKYINRNVFHSFLIQILEVKIR